MKFLSKIILSLALLLVISSPALAKEGILDWIRPMFWHQVKVQSVDSNNLTVLINNATYQVAITNDTKLIRRWGSGSKLSEFRVGDIIQIQGKLNDQTITPRLIRNLSVQKKKVVLAGKIQSIDAPHQTFYLKTKAVNSIAVSLEDATRITEKRVDKKLTDLVVGMEVIVSGFKNNDSMNEVVQVVVLPGYQK